MSPPSNPTSSSRMSLSALVNSPPPPLRPTPPRFTSQMSPRATYHPPPGHPAHASGPRYVSPSEGRYSSHSYAQNSEANRGYLPHEPPYDTYRSTSPAYQNNFNNGNDSAPGPSRRALVPDARLSGSEDCWEEVLRLYQKRREAEAAEISLLDPSSGVSRVRP